MPHARSAQNNSRAVAGGPTETGHPEQDAESPSRFQLKLAWVHRRSASCQVSPSLNPAAPTGTEVDTWSPAEPAGARPAEEHRYAVPLTVAVEVVVAPLAPATPNWGASCCTKL